jgi:hypothetical protein
MRRTQVYLTDEQVQAIKLLASRSGLKQSELIRQALNEFLAVQSSRDWKAEIMSVSGLWAEREDLPDFSRLRDEFDRLS